MEEQITAARIANAICQDTSFAGMYLLVEGKRDVKLYGKFVEKPSVRVKPTWGKYKLREVYGILRDRGISNTLGIRDADFLRIKGNSKFSETFEDPIFVTDHHDAEIMIAFSGAIDEYFSLISDADHIEQFEKKIGSSIFDLTTSLCYEMGCLRLANKRLSLGLSFKPEKPEGNKIKIHKFIDTSNWSISRSLMINTIWEYSQNRGLNVASRDVIEQAIKSVSTEGHSINELINGHDLSAVLHIISTSGLKSKNKLLQDSGCVEDLLIAVFDIKRFSVTKLYERISVWSQEKMGIGVFQSP